MFTAVPNRELPCVAVRLQYAGMDILTYLLWTLYYTRHLIILTDDSGAFYAAPVHSRSLWKSLEYGIILARYVVVVLLIVLLIA